MGSTLCRCRKNKVASSIPPSEEAEKDSDEIFNDHHSTILSASFGGDANEIQHNQEANSVSRLEGKRNGETSPENEREDSDEMLSDHQSTISSASFGGDVNEIQHNQEANSVSGLKGKTNGETLPENEREDSDEMFSGHHSTLPSSSFGVDVNEIQHNQETNSVSGLEGKRNGETSPENEREDVGRRLSDHDSVESVSNGQAVHINSGTESGQEGAVDSSTNVSQEEHASLDESFLYSKNVIVVRSFEETYDKGSSSDVNSICSEDNGGHTYESSTCLGNEGQDKIPGDEVVHKEDVLEKSASTEDFKATSSDEDDISIIDCPSCEISTNIDQVKNESIQDDAPLAVHHFEDNTGFPINVKPSLPSVRVSGIGNRDQPEDDINSNGCPQNHKNVARMYSNNHSNSNSSIGVEVISSGTAARSGDAECSKNDSVHDCDRCSGGDYSLVVPFADESDDIYLHDRGDGNLGIVTAFRSGNGEAECTDVDADPGREDKADAGRTDSENGALGGTSFRSCGCDDEVTDDDDFGILGKYDDSHSHVRVLNDDYNDHNKKDNDDSDEDEPDNSCKDSNKNSDKNGTHDDANAKDDGGDQFFEQGDDAGILSKQQETLSEKQSTPQIPFPVDVDVMEYISASKYQALFQSFLEDKGIIFNWKEGSIAYIEYYGHANDAVKALNSFFLDFKTQDISVKEEVWNCVVAKISTFCSHLGDNPPLIKVDGYQMKLRIVSFKQNIDNYEKRLKDWLKKLKKETSLEQRTFSKCSKDDILLLKKINFRDNYLGKDCKDVEMAFDLENVEIRMKGPTLQLDIVMERLQEQEIATEEKPLRLPQSILEFLKTDKGQEAIDRTLEQHQVEAIVLFDDPSPSKQLSARVRGYAIEAMPHIHNIAVEKEKTVEESNVRLTATRDWAELCNKVRIEQGVFIRSNDSGRIWITGFKKNVEKAAERLQEFVDANSIEKEEYMCPSRETRKYIKVHCVEDLDTMTRDLKEFEVKFLPRDDDRTIYMSGHRKGLDKAKDYLDKLVNSFVVRRLERRQPGLQKYFEMDGIGHRRIELLEHDQKCLIRIERDFDHQRDSHRYFVTAQAHMISWKIGDIAKEQVHTLVSPQGACTDALLNSNPSVPPQVSARVKAGEISVLSASGVYLPWSHIFFTNCSNWNGGKGEECLRTIVKTSLQKVESLNGNSVAFPAIGTGNLQFPPKQAARIMLDETAKFCQENPTSDLKDIRFILLGRDKMVIDAFSQEMVNLQNNFSGRSPPQTGEETWCKNVKIAQGDLTKEFQSEAILNVIGSDVNITRAGSISERVFRAAGSHLEQEFRQLHDRSQRPKALMTSGGNLSSSHIIHIIPSSSDKREIKKSLEKGLLLAKQNNIPSISLPAVGTGGHGLPPSDSAKLIFQTLKSVWGNCANFPSVRIVLLQSPELIRAFELEKKGQLAPQHQEGSRRKTKMGRINIEVEEGNLICEETDAILNIVNADMDMENAGELSKEIAQVCGSQVKGECRKMGPQPGGSAVMTSGGDLNTRNIIHLIPGSSDVNHLQMCLEKCLRLADSKKLHSISLPAIGTGGYGMSAVISAKMIFQALASFSRNCVSLRNVRIVVRQKVILEAFKQEQKKQHETNYAAASTRPTFQPIRLTVIGKNQNNVDKAIAELKRDFSQNCVDDKLQDGYVCNFSESQINTLLRKAESHDVEMTVDAARGCIALRGGRDDVHAMTKKIHEEISQTREQEKSRQEDENAEMVSKTVEWTYKLHGKKISFDSKTTLQIEMAHSRGDSSIEVSSLGENFIIEFRAKTGYRQSQNEPVTVTRKLKEAEEIPLPEHWDEMPSDTQDVLTVPLKADSSEYSNVSQKFYATAADANITKIERIQHPYRYRCYVLRKQKMDKDNGGCNEKQLFHGTSAETTKAINTQGFNRSFCGKNATAYGKGVYFARDARYSQNYTDSNDLERCMYLARVLVGQYCQGNTEMRAPPPKFNNRSDILYDSTVDKPVNPTIFVAFYDDQCYPEYLIYFQQVAKEKTV